MTAESLFNLASPSACVDSVTTTVDQGHARGLW